MNPMITMFLSKAMNKKGPIKEDPISSTPEKSRPDYYEEEGKDVGTSIRSAQTSGTDYPASVHTHGGIQWGNKEDDWDRWKTDEDSDGYR